MGLRVRGGGGGEGRDRKARWMKWTRKSKGMRRWKRMGEGGVLQGCSEDEAFT